MAKYEDIIANQNALTEAANQSVLALDLVKSAIERSGTEVADGTPVSEYGGMIDGIGDEAFWQTISHNYTRTNWNYAFQYTDLSGFKEPKQTLQNAGDVLYMFNYYQGKRIPDCFDLSKGWDLTFTFRNAQFLEVCQDMNIPVPKSGKGYPGTWQFCYNLETIEVVRCNENTIFDASFHSCKKLKNITFEGVIGQDISFEQSTVLSKASIYNIVMHLSPEARDKTLTLSSAAVESAYGSMITTEFWNMVASCVPYWTITLI